MRKCRVLIRKGAGLGWPPDAVSHRGELVSLQGVFHEAGMVLEIERIDAALPGLPGGRAFEPADLHAALVSTLTLAGVDETSWTACVLVVPEIVTSCGSRLRRPLGLMFDTGAFDADGRPRQGCAVAGWRFSDPRVFLRTVAHELGHVFNLAHPGEGAEPFGRDAVNTLMVPSEALRPSNRLPETIAFRFTPAQRHWLAHAPEPYVRPGGLEYGCRPPHWPANPADGASC